MQDTSQQLTQEQLEQKKSMELSHKHWSQVHRFEFK